MRLDESEEAKFVTLADESVHIVTVAREQLRAEVSCDGAFQQSKELASVVLQSVAPLLPLVKS
jgi:hypothetical protein